VYSGAFVKGGGAGVGGKEGEYIFYCIPILPSVVGHMTVKRKGAGSNIVGDESATNFDLHYSCSCVHCGYLGRKPGEGVKSGRNARKVSLMILNYLPLSTCQSAKYGCNGKTVFLFYSSVVGCTGIRGLTPGDQIQENFDLAGQKKAQMTFLLRHFFPLKVVK
jgi:hypothetical protein